MTRISTRKAEAEIRGVFASAQRLSERAKDNICTIGGGTCCGDFTYNVSEKCCLDANGKNYHYGDKDGTCCGGGIVKKGRLVVAMA